MVSKSNVKNIYSLTPLQEGMLFHALESPGDAAYFEQISYRIRGQFNERYFQKSLEHLLDRHDILRTLFVHENTPQPLQVVLKKRQIQMQVQDLSDLDAEESALRLQDYKTADRQQAFLLHAHLLLRVGVFKLSEEKFEMVWSFHHIIMDGWSFGILLDELSAIYFDLSQGRPPQLPPVVPFGKYIQWLEGRDVAATKAYWAKYLNGYASQSPVPQQKAVHNPYHLQEFHRELAPETYAALQQLAKSESITLGIVLQTFWGILLGKYNRNQDVVFGIPVSGRPTGIPGVENMIGLLINTIPRRIQWEAATTIADLLRDVQGHQLNSEDHQFLSLAEIQSLSSLRDGLFDHLLVFENYPVSQRLQDSLGQEGSGLQVEDISAFEHTHYPFMLSVEATDQLRFRYSYDANRLDRKFVERMAGHLEQLLTSWIENPTAKVNALPWLPPAEQAQLIQEWNATENLETADHTMLSRFTEMALQHPEEIALTDEDRNWTYAEVYQRAQQVAYFLTHEKGLSPQTYVALQLERSPEMIFAIYGVLLVGCIYVPISPDAPDKRRATILEDCGAQVLLDRKTVSASEKLPTTHRTYQPSPNDLAYLIYTSGSTGKPKGVMVQHHAICNRLDWMHRAYPPGEQAVFMLKTSYTFDVSIWELFAWTYAGGRLYLLPPGKEMMPDSILQAISQHQVTHIHFVPSMLSFMLEELQQTGGVELTQTLRQVSSSGEAISPDQVRRFYGHFPKEVLLLNVYGPTEASIEVSHYDCREALELDLVPMGKPIDNLQLYIMDAAMQGVQPIGIPGEIAIGGKGLALGYLGREDLTQDRFRPNPFLEGGRIYLTGDLGMWREDGNIAYLGRLDQQVKIRGFRVELGEIEWALEVHPQVLQVAIKALDLQGNGLELYAWVRVDQDLDPAGIKAHLAQLLPTYMIPTHFVFLNEFPLSPSGKIDKKRLPLPVPISTPQNSDSIQETGLTEDMARIWRKILGVPQVTATSNFFDLGGHSLKAIRLVSAIRKHLKKELAITDVFAAPVLAEMCSRLQDKSGFANGHIPMAPISGRYALSPAQRQIWIQHQMEAHPAAYNISAAWRIVGQLHLQNFERAFDLMINRHEILRTSFHEKAGVPEQQIHPPFRLRIETRDLATTNQEAAMEVVSEWTGRAFDLAELPLLKVLVITQTDGEQLLVFCIHHILSDEWSFRFMVKEVFDAYNALQAGQTPQFPPLRIQYKDYAAYVNAQLKNGEMAEAASYWRDYLPLPIPELQLPFDFPRPPTFSYTGETLRFELNGGHWTCLQEATQKEKGTLFLTLQCLVSILLADIAQAEEIMLGTPVAGRDQPELENQIGFYLNTRVLRNRITPEMSFSEVYARIKKDNLAALTRQNYPFEELVRHLGIERKTGRNPLFDVLYVFQNFETIDTTTPADLEFHPVDLPGGGSKFDLTLGFVEGRESLYANFEYNTALFEPSTIQMLESRLKKIIERLPMQDNASVADLWGKEIIGAEPAVNIDFDFD